MFLSEIVGIYKPEVKVITLITTEEIEWRLCRDSNLKKSDFTKEEWAQLMESCSLSIRNSIPYSKIGSLIKNEVGKMFPGKLASQAGQK